MTSIWVPTSVNIVWVAKFGLNINSKRDIFILSFLILNNFINVLISFFSSSLIGVWIFKIEPIFLEISLNSFWFNFGTASCCWGNLIFLIYGSSFISLIDSSVIIFPKFSRFVFNGILLHSGISNIPFSVLSLLSFSLYLLRTFSNDLI